MCHRLLSVTLCNLGLVAVRLPAAFLFDEELVAMTIAEWTELADLMKPVTRRLVDDNGLRGLVEGIVLACVSESGVQNSDARRVAKRVMVRVFGVSLEAKGAV